MKPTACKSRPPRKPGNIPGAGLGLVLILWAVAVTAAISFYLGARVF